jgi:hypothetical protein
LGAVLHSNVNELFENPIEIRLVEVYKEPIFLFCFSLLESLLIILDSNWAGALT